MNIIKVGIDRLNKEWEDSVSFMAHYLHKRRLKQIAVVYTLALWLGVLFLMVFEPQRFSNLIQISCNLECERQVALPTTLIFFGVVALLFLKKRDYKRVLKLSLVPFVIVLILIQRI